MAEGNTFTFSTWNLSPDFTFSTVNLLIVVPFWSFLQSYIYWLSVPCRPASALSSNPVNTPCLSLSIDSWWFTFHTEKITPPPVRGGNRASTFEFPASFPVFSAARGKVLPRSCSEYFSPTNNGNFYRNCTEVLPRLDPNCTPVLFPGVRTLENFWIYNHWPQLISH